MLGGLIIAAHDIGERKHGGAVRAGGAYRATPCLSFGPSSHKLSFAAPTRVEDHMIGLGWVFLLLVVPTFLSGWIAERRGRSTTLWYWLGAIFGPIAPFVVALLPPTSEPGSRPRDRRLVDCGAGRMGEPLASAARATPALSWCAPRRRCGRYPTCSHWPSAPLAAKVTFSWGQSATFALWGV